ncbi:hypothetical protein [Burkholderia glumae]|uniref:hypothetical protein n=1 Tax=Burkholderia glumae TaxID=337 RepID=UPI0009B7DF73|nr:hypothetical protein [Burkholderia glumae]MCM2494565.1 DNA-binding protein [Burkholderia glumae]
MTPQALAKAKAAIYSRGQTIEGWAREHGFPPVAVYRFLNGLEKGRRGRSYQIAVALGLKPAETQFVA